MLYVLMNLVIEIIQSLTIATDTPRTPLFITA